MKRDMDLVRKILLAVEEENVFENDWRPEIGDHSPEEIVYHVELMKDAGLLDIDIRRFLDDSLPLIYLRRMTWEGHEFLDAARNESIWSQAKAKVLQTTGGLGFEALKAALSQLIREVGS